MKQIETKKARRGFLRPGLIHQLTTSNHINGSKNRIPVQPCASCEIFNSEMNPMRRVVAEKFGVKESQIANAISQRHWATASVAEQIKRREHRKLGNKSLKQCLDIDGLRSFHFQFADAFKITNAEARAFPPNEGTKHHGMMRELQNGKFAMPVMDNSTNNVKSSRSG